MDKKMDDIMRKYPSLKKFMLLNNIKDKKHAKILLQKIKDNYKTGNFKILEF